MKVGINIHTFTVAITMFTARTFNPICKRKNTPNKYIFYSIDLKKVIIAIVIAKCTIICCNKKNWKIMFLLHTRNDENCDNLSANKIQFNYWIISIMKKNLRFTSLERCWQNQIASEIIYLHSLTKILHNKKIVLRLMLNIFFIYSLNFTIIFLHCRVIILLHFHLNELKTNVWVIMQGTLNDLSLKI